MNNFSPERHSAHTAHPSFFIFISSSTYSLLFVSLPQSRCGATSPTPTQIGQTSCFCFFLFLTSLVSHPAPRRPHPSLLPAQSPINLFPFLHLSPPFKAGELCLNLLPSSQHSGFFSKKHWRSHVACARFFTPSSSS